MSILKFENRTPRSLSKMYEYMIDPQKTDVSAIFGIGVNPSNAVNEMKFIQNLYRKENLTHEYLQIIFVFDVGVKAEMSLIREVCERIGAVLVTDKRQVFGAIHYLGKEANHISCHYMVNYVGIDGVLYKQKYSVVHYKKLVNQILSEYGFNLIHYYDS